MPPASASAIDLELSRLFEGEAFCDVAFDIQGTRIYAHRVCLLAASPIFDDLFLPDSGSSPLIKRISTDQQTSDDSLSPPQYGDIVYGRFSEPAPEVTIDTAKLLENAESCFRSSIETVAITTTVTTNVPVKIFLNHPIFLSVESCDVAKDDVKKVLPTLRNIITVDSIVSPAVFQAILHYLYTGRYPAAKLGHLVEVRQVADSLGLADLAFAVTNILNNEDYMNKDVFVQFHAQRCQRIRELLIDKGLFSGTNLDL